MIVNDVMLIESPVVMDVVVRFKSAPDVPTVPSIICVAPEVAIRNQVAVQVATAVAADGKVGVRTALEAPGANGEPIVKVAATVVAVPPVAGCVPQ